MPPASTGRGAERFLFCKLEQPRPPLPSSGTPSCFSLIGEVDLGESARGRRQTKRFTAEYAEDAEKTQRGC
jgi:hypothetical protein